jgi:hypothetical protein
MSLVETSARRDDSLAPRIRLATVRDVDTIVRILIASKEESFPDLIDHAVEIEGSWAIWRDIGRLASELPRPDEGLLDTSPPDATRLPRLSLFRLWDRLFRR